MNAPKTTPECKRLENLVIDGLNAKIFEPQIREAARVALKRLSKKKCAKSLEYIIQKSCNSPLWNDFAREICDEATKYLKELS